MRAVCLGLLFGGVCSIMGCTNTPVTQEGLVGAVLSPMEDLNLKRADIPPTFRNIENPYNVAPDLSCPQIAAEVETLNTLLGRDWDSPPPDEKDLSDQASTAVLDTASSATSGLIPYRGIVRTVTGADTHARKVYQAYQRGSHRRSFLKGMGLIKGCLHPAGPLTLPEEEPGQE